MTTIVYDHKNRQIACDGRALQGHDLLTDSYQKWQRVDGNICFFSGAVADIGEFIKHPKEFGNKPPCAIEVNALRVVGDKVFECGIDDDSGYFEMECSFSIGIGSGSDFALAALDHGKSARESVEYAMTRDVGTGGQVSVFDLDIGEFID